MTTASSADSDKRKKMHPIHWHLGCHLLVPSSIASAFVCYVVCESGSNHFSRSQAEFLQSLVPDAHVVKAFNVLSAYSLESGGLQGSKEVVMQLMKHNVYDTDS